MQRAGTEWHKPRRLSVPLARQPPMSRCFPPPPPCRCWHHMENGSGVPLNCSRTTATQRAAADTRTATALCMWHFWSSSICNQSNYIFMAFINQPRKRHPRAGMCVCLHTCVSSRFFAHLFTAERSGGHPGHVCTFPTLNSQDDTLRSDCCRRFLNT